MKFLKITSFILSFRFFKVFRSLAVNIKLSLFRWLKLVKVLSSRSLGPPDSRKQTDFASQISNPKNKPILRTRQKINRNIIFVHQSIFRGRNFRFKKLEWILETRFVLEYDMTRVYQIHFLFSKTKCSTVCESRMLVIFEFSKIWESSEKYSIMYSFCYVVIFSVRA